MFIYRGKGSIPRTVRRVEFHRSVKFIPHRLFKDCRQLESVLLHEGLLGIGNYAFHHCSSLRSFRSPPTVTEIGAGAFDGCWNLATVDLPEGLEAIEEVTFGGCTSLEEVRIPASVDRIGDYAFSGCTNLTSVDLHEGLRLIGDHAFDDCRSLESLRVPSSVDEIGKEVFDRCSSLSLVQLCDDLPKIKEDAFGGCPLESFRFVILSKRMEAIRMDNRTKSMFDSRLREITLYITRVDHDDEGGAEAVREKCKECLGRAHQFLTYLELKGASSILELALWKMKIQGEGEERVQGGLVGNEVRGHDLSDALQARERRKLMVNKDTDRDPRLSCTDFRVKCGAGIVSSEVLKFFAFSTTWPQMGD